MLPDLAPTLQMQRRVFLNSMGTLAASSLIARSTPTTVAVDPQTQDETLESILNARDNELLDDNQFWLQIRKLFPLRTNRAYFNTGGLSASPYSVLGTVNETMIKYHTAGEHGHKEFVEAHTPVAKLLGCSPTDIAFGRNATEGNSTVANGLGLKAGDEIILDSRAHPGGGICWMVLQKELGIKVKLFRPSSNNIQENLDSIEKQWTPKTRVIQVSHVTAPTGIKMPVKEIGEWAQRKNLWFHVDGAQSAGMYPFDLLKINCDSFATSGHKWMLGPHGTGVLWVKPDRRDELIPTDVGAYSSQDYELPNDFSYHPSAQRYEAGTQDASSAAGLAKAAEFLMAIGMDQVAKHGHGLATYLREQLNQIEAIEVLSPSDKSLASSITTFRPTKMDYQELYRQISSQHFRVRIVNEDHLNGIRISTHICNSYAECESLVKTIRSILVN